MLLKNVAILLVDKVSPSTGNVYPRAVMEKAALEYNARPLGRFYGELRSKYFQVRIDIEHFSISEERLAIKTSDLRVVDSPSGETQLVGDVEILGTTSGEFLKKYLPNGYPEFARPDDYPVRFALRSHVEYELGSLVNGARGKVSVCRIIAVDAIHG
jgi:hypothetical protein